jgi:hypothetical protein
MQTKNESGFLPLYSKGISIHEISILGNLFFLVLFIYSIVYALERTTYVDSAWLFFERVNGETFTFPGDRYSAFFSEIPLYFASKLHLPIKYLIYIFSVSYILLYYIVWRICTFRLKNPAAGLTVIFGIVLGARETFLHPVSETHQMIAYSAMLYAALAYQWQSVTKKWIFTLFVTVLVMFTHPMALFTAGFALLYYIIETRKFKDIIIWVVFLIILLLGLLNYIHPANPYDAAQISQINNTGLTPLYGNGALTFLLIHFKHFYWLPEVMALILFVFLIYKKEWLKLLILILSVSAFLTVALIIFRKGDSSIMLERVFLPAFFMINLAFAEMLFRLKINKWVPIALLVFFFVNGIRYINAGCLMYKKRVAYLDTIVKAGIEQGYDKYYLSQARIDKDRILVPWALGTETLIYSKFKYNKCISITMEPVSCPPNTIPVTSWSCLPAKDLNPNYFTLTSDQPVELK